MVRVDYQHHHQRSRSLTIDVLRGLAVIGMIVAHALFFFHNRTNGILTFAEQTLNATVFSVFVFVFGMSLAKWLDIHAHDSAAYVWKLTVRRAGIVYLVYALTAAAALLTSGRSPATGLNELGGALMLSAPPNFTEYMPLFVLLILMIPLGRPLLRYTRTSILLTAVVAALSYLSGIVLFQLRVPGWLSGWKALIAGDGETLGFPLLFYFPVMLAGLWWEYDIDHTKQDPRYSKRHYAFMAAMVVLTVSGVMLSRFFTVPVFNPLIRWPPSVTFLSFGLSIATVSLLLFPSFSRLNIATRRAVAYFGRDALDLWASHLLLLFLYSRFVSFASGNIPVVAGLTAVLVIASVVLSSVVIDNTVRFPVNISFGGKTRFRKRYVAYAGIAILVLVWTSLIPAGSPYGNVMQSPPLLVQQKFPSDSAATLTASHIWYVRRNPRPEPVDLTVTVESVGKNVSVKPEAVRLTVNGEPMEFSGIAASDFTLHFTKPAEDFAPGTYTVRASVDNGNASIESNPVTIHVSEPLLVAWTFDWEGWDIPDAAMTSINDLTVQFPTVRFTHFVSPRMYLPGILTPQRSAHLTRFLSGRAAAGDEIALHLHMHYDLVSAAGVSTRSAQPWGLMTDQGYDTPTTEYTPEEFRRIVRFAVTVASESGLPRLYGYRAGGWFLSTEQLNELPELGFSYDSSGRDRPQTGAFRRTPWNLPVGAQPYYPSVTDQNIPGDTGRGFLEIPDNGLSTYDQTPDMLKARMAAVYRQGILSTPKTLLYVSHPQFYAREFSKIGDVLSAVAAVSQVADRGPAIFVTTDEIKKIWDTLND